MEMSGRRALVTGGTAGIGLACARRLADAGAEVTVTGRDVHRGRSAAHGRGIRFIRADMADPAAVRALVDTAGDIDVLVYNAAVFPGALTLEQEMTVYERTVDVNLRGVYFLTAGLARGMTRRGHGSIVNISSMVAVKGVPAASTYSATKAAIESLTRTWAVEFGPFGVRVNAVARGPPAPKASPPSGVTSTSNSDGRYRSAAPDGPTRSRRLFCFWPPNVRASSLAPPCAPTAAVRQPETFAAVDE